MRQVSAMVGMIILALASFALLGCGPVSDCFGEDTISESEYDDLNVLEQLLYEENDCGRYEPR